MKAVTVEQVSQGIYAHIPTEDVVGYVQRGDSLLAWAIDGASTLTETPFTTFPEVTDAGWFARELSRLLAERFQHTLFSPAQLRLVLQELREVYQQAGGHPQPLWAWPVAAATVLEIDLSASPARLVSYHYADCFIAAWRAAAEAERVLDDAVMPAAVYDPWKPYSGFQGGQRDRLWSRREQQQRNESSSALTLNPESALNATLQSETLHRPGHVLLGSDGLSRIWDTYHLMTQEQALQCVAQHGLPALLGVLRAFEASARTGDAGLKRRDDASGIHLYVE